ncbi:heat-inducible transcriptional repressor HrcA [Thiohalomonas denitrificans]|uniref:heat-inducible transcriptional repressor HrcA n=1 Tax=Thiohalomonas denitrificans TaxID=415747 RepID=UPI0026EA8745|nr:heat-inducible transcriptional repressor HrcA [Thiohalomonas denitrificans]
MAGYELTERAQYLFKALVERHIRDGQPVGSRTLARDSKLNLSPATIRNVMADLEEARLIRSPHTSAGRVPTAQGYRFFVDTLLTIKPLDEEELRGLEAQFESGEDPGRLLSSASSLLSDVTSLAGVVMLPRREQVALRQIEFLPLSASRVLVILVVNEREVQNRIIHTTRRYSGSELTRAANFINEHFAGRTLREVRNRLIQQMQADREDMDRLMRSALEMAQQAFSEDDDEDDYLMAGETNLMSYAEMSDMKRLRRLFEAFGTKRDILHLLDQSLAADGLQIFIGNEAGHEALDVCSIVTSPYKVEDRVVGVLGVIGPTRMAYGRVIPIVDITARLLGAALNPDK